MYFKTNFNPLCFACFDNMAARIVATVQVGLFCGKHCVWWWWHGWRADDRAGSWAAIQCVCGNSFLPQFKKVVKSLLTTKNLTKVPGVPSHILARSFLTLSQPKGQIMPTELLPTHPPLDFQTFLHPFLIWFLSPDFEI